jgi:hypothetical protein
MDVKRKECSTAWCRDLEYGGQLFIEVQANLRALGVPPEQ